MQLAISGHFVVFFLLFGMLQLLVGFRSVLRTISPALRSRLPEGTGSKRCTAPLIIDGKSIKSASKTC